MRLLETQPTEHRLELARGKMSARIWAPPRLFFVDTPSAVAADLGCAYTLEVDDQGASLLQVTSGWVALELKDRESMVPAGAPAKRDLGLVQARLTSKTRHCSFAQSLKKSTSIRTQRAKSAALTFDAGPCASARHVDALASADAC